jgi:hypothetical protein
MSILEYSTLNPSNVYDLMFTNTKKLVFSELPGPQRLLRALTLDNDNSPLSSTIVSDGSLYAPGASVDFEGFVFRW